MFCDGRTVPTHTCLQLVLTLPMASRTHPPRRAGLPIGFPQCPREGGAIIRTTRKMPGRPFQRRRTEKPTGERTTETGEEHKGAVAGDFWRDWEEDGP
ncbi:hypothetical protein NDU88_005046 [Pleurodeles waltl]|uniref:Uncharacterized protein n=1 Tax=Pleurodeles waltl TaxID=8319 RepID=A0AAV7WWT2_PLEWA|nr:hypothetical protein NDU88_005046 [Pleurodeles waltl]